MSTKLQRMKSYVTTVKELQDTINFYRDQINRLYLKRQKAISGSGLKSLSIEKAIHRLEKLDERLSDLLSKAEEGPFENYMKIADWHESNQRQLKALKSSQRKRVNVYEFSYELMDEIKDRISIVDMVDELNMRKKRSGGNRYVMICPFHDEKTPSFMIYADEDKYHCFGCQASGDVIDFYQTYLEIEFDEAITRLCDRLSIQVMDADQVEQADELIEKYEQAIASTQEQLNLEKINFAKGVTNANHN